MTPQITTAASYGTSAGAIFLGLSTDEWGIIGVVFGISIAALTYATNVWFKFRAEKRSNKRSQ